MPLLSLQYFALALRFCALPCRGLSSLCFVVPHHAFASCAMRSVLCHLRLAAAAQILALPSRSLAPLRFAFASRLFAVPCLCIARLSVALRFFAYPCRRAAVYALPLLRSAPPCRCGSSLSYAFAVRCALRLNQFPLKPSV